MSWESEPAFGAAHKAALSAEKNIVYVSPPAMWAIRPLLERLPAQDPDRFQNLFLVPGLADTLELSYTLNRTGELGACHAATGLTRSTRLVDSGVATLVATPGDTLRMLRASTGRIRDARRVFLWNVDVMLEQGDSADLDTILSECSAAQRIIHTGRSVPEDFVERHARRAPQISAYPEPNPRYEGRVRYALVEGERLAWATRKCLDILDPETAFVWDPYGRMAVTADLGGQPGVEVADEPEVEPVVVAIATELPSASMLAQLAAMASEVIVLARPSQLAALQRVATDLKPFKLPSESDRSRDRAGELRRLVREQIAAEAGDLAFTLGALEPLFYEADPAVVAAAALAVAARTTPEPSSSDHLPAWVKVFLSVGKKDGLTARDVVGAVLNSTGLSRDSVGKVEIRDTITLVEIPPRDTEKVVAELNGAMLKGRRVTARVDRKGQPSR